MGLLSAIQTPTRASCLLLVVCAFLAQCASAELSWRGAPRRLHSDVRTDNKDFKLRTHSQWSAQNARRRLSGVADSPYPGPPTYATPPSPGTPSPPGSYTPGGYGGGCNTLLYTTGYVNLTTEYYKIIDITANLGVCCTLCDQDPECVAWTRVAGGSPLVRTCYLKSNLTADPDPDSYLHNTAPLSISKLYPEVRYVDPTWEDPSEPLILESGTKWGELPAVLYGCPWPNQSGGQCLPPPLCNCYEGTCYGPCN